MGLRICMRHYSVRSICRQRGQEMGREVGGSEGNTINQRRGRSLEDMANSEFFCFIIQGLGDWRACVLSHVRSLSMGFSRQESWSGLPYPTPEGLPNPGIKPASPALTGRFFTTEPSEKPLGGWIFLKYLFPKILLPICWLILTLQKGRSCHTALGGPHSLGAQGSVATDGGIILPAAPLGRAT